MSQESSNKPSEPVQRQISEREKLIGLGRRSVSKSYYPELKKRIDELEQFRALLDQVSDTIFVIDAETGCIIDVSGASKAMIGCDREALIDIPFATLLPSHIGRYTGNIFNNNTRKIQIETELHSPETPPKMRIPVDMSILLATHAGQRRAIVVARDISERKEAERELKRSHDQLEIRVRERTRELDRANKAKSEFLAMVSHELRTPLTSILGFTKVIHKKLVAKVFPHINCTLDENLTREMERICKNLEIISAEGNRLTTLINDVLDLAKLEANRMEYDLRPVKPEEFINRSLESTEGLFKNTQLLLLLDVEPDLPDVTGDLDRLIQVMVNLLSNAVKFTPEGTIKCKAHRVDDKIRVSVADTGIGMDESKVKSIFEKFTQVHDDKLTQPRGTGLGLAISQHIIKAHHGDIWAESQIGKGSRFIFTLPIVK